MRRRLFGLGLVAACAVGLGCGSHQAAPRPTGDERLPRLEVVTPLLTNLVRRIDLVATVEPMERADLCVRVPGVVHYPSPDIDIGRQVRAGEVLAKLAVPDLAAQQKHKEALLEQARRQKALAEEMLRVAAKDIEEAAALEKRYAADYQFAKFQHERITALVNKGAQQPERAQETQKQLDAAQAAWDAAKVQIETRRAKHKASAADLAVAESKVGVAEADVQNLTALLGLATITAPFDGVISKRWLDNGATVKDPGAPLLTVMRTDKVRVLMDIPERDVPLVNSVERRPNPDGRGDPVTLRLSALPGQEFTRQLTRISDALDLTTRTMRAEVHLDNAKGLLRPGMSGSATIILESRYNVLTVPATALVRHGGKVEVFYVTGAAGDPLVGELARREVELGLDDGILVEVSPWSDKTGRGLTGKELVVVKGNGAVRAGDRVVAVPPRE
jgi:RND family efflux transporter MFP subunit